MIIGTQPLSSDFYLTIRGAKLRERIGIGTQPVFIQIFLLSNDVYMGKTYWNTAPFFC